MNKLSVNWAILLMCGLAGGLWGCSAEATTCGGSLVIDVDDLDDDGDTSECIANSCSSGAPDCADYDVDDADDDGVTCECDGGGEGEGEGGLGDVAVEWTINGTATGGASYDTCEDVGADVIVMDLQVEGESIFKELLVVDCPEFAATMLDVPAGTYELNAQLQMSNGDALTDVLLYTVDVVAEEVAAVDVDFAIADFIAVQPRLGTYAFTVTWDGLECDEAVPAVNQEIALLEMDGNLVAGAQVCLEDGTQVCSGGSQCVDANGTDVHCCYPSDVTQNIPNVEWGTYLLTISGVDHLANICFETEFTVFVGAGENPTDGLNVESITNPNCN
jgi:hypothetical protein